MASEMRPVELIDENHLGLQTSITIIRYSQYFSQVNDVDDVFVIHVYQLAKR